MSLKNKQFAFGAFRLDPSNRVLLRGEKPVSLAPKAFDTLAYLAENNGRLVSRTELMRSIWPDSVVEDANLTVNISLLRKALGNDQGGRPYIETVPRKGYRFNADVKLIDENIQPDLISSAPPEWHPRQGPAGETQRRGDLPFQRWALAAAIVIILLGIATAIWHPSARVTHFRQRRLTSFAPEAAVTAAAISSGAKFIAYANPSGLFIQVIATAETHALELPQPGFQVSSISWFPDSAKLLVDGIAPREDAPGLWVVPVIGTGKSVEIGPYPPGFVSPGGSEIALAKNADSDPQLLIMQSDGGNARTLVTGAKDETFGSPSWGQDGKHLFFVRYKWNAQLRANSGSIESYDLATGKTTTVLSGANFAGDVVSLPDGHLVYSIIPGANPSAYGGELVEVAKDRKAGKAMGQPLAIATWDTPVTNLSVSANGKQLVFRDLIVQHSGYMGDLERANKRLLNIRRFTFGLGREDFPRAWAPDSKAIFVDSNRNGNWEIFKQGLDEDSDTPFIQGSDDHFSPRISPDGKWLLYLERPANWHEPQPVSLMRVPVSGGVPEVVLTASQFSEWGLRFECPQRAGMPCVLAQRRGGEVVFRRFDPLKGLDSAAPDIARHTYDPHRVNWAIAPNGSRIAWINWDAKEARIHIISLRDASEHSVAIPGWSHLHAISWAPDGKGWFLIAQFPASWTLLYADLQGRAQALWKVTSTFAPDLYPSPDGKHLAFSEQSFGSNVWLLQNF